MKVKAHLWLAWPAWLAGGLAVVFFALSASAYGQSSWDPLQQGLDRMQQENWQRQQQLEQYLRWQEQERQRWAAEAAAQRRHQEMMEQVRLQQSWERQQRMREYNRQREWEETQKRWEMDRWNQADEALGAERARARNCFLGRGHVDNC